MRGSLIAAENKIKERLCRMSTFMKIGARKVGKLSKRDLFIAGLALYWAEGSKKNRRVELINSDPAIIKIWISWLKAFTKMNDRDLTLCVGINEIHRPRIGKVQKYWSHLTGIRESQFRSPSFKKVRNRKVYDNYDSHFGSLCVRTRKSTNLNYEILGQIAKLGMEAGS